MRAKRVDGNHAVVRDALRSVAGIVVQDLSGAGSGIPDLLVGCEGRNFLLEVKDPSKPPSRRRLTRAQESWHAGWTGQVAVVETPEQALRVVLGVHEKAPEE